MNTLNARLIAIASALLSGAVVAAVAGLWSWCFGAVVVLTVGVMLKLNRHRRAASQPETSQEEPSATSAQSVRVGMIRLQSKRPQTCFRLAVRVHWTSLAAVDSPRTAEHLAVDAVVARAREVAADCNPDELALLDDELTLVLGSQAQDPSGRLVAWGTDIRVCLAESEQRHLERMAELRQHTELWDLEIEHERKVRQYLQNDALTSTASAVVWWLSQNPGEVERCVELTNVLRRLSDTAAGRHMPDADASGTERDELPEAAVAALINDVANEDGGLFAARLAEIVSDAGRPDVATEVRRTYNVELVEPTDDESDRHLANRPSSDSALVRPFGEPDDSGRTGDAALL